LHLGFARSRAGREDVENQLGAIHDAAADCVLEILSLRRRQLVVEDGDCRLRPTNELGELVDLAGSEVGGRVRPIELLRQLADDGSAGSVSEEGQLAEVLARGVAIGRPLQRRADEDDALLRSLERDQIFSDEGKLQRIECRVFRSRGTGCTC
jgi:hypothetical protein